MQKPTTGKPKSLLQRLLLGSNNAPDRETHANFKKHGSMGEMEVVFVTGGISYYRFVNEQRIPAFRAMAARDVFQELELKMTKEMSLAYLDAIDEAFNEGDLIQAGALLSLYRERHSYITHIDLLYKLASVLYFDNSENVEDFDPMYSHEKIARWKKEMDVEAFFLQTPIIEYLPFSDLQGFDLARFTALQRGEDLRQSKMLLRTLAPGEQNDDTRRHLHLLMETLGSSPSSAG